MCHWYLWCVKNGKWILVVYDCAFWISTTLIVLNAGLHTYHVNMIPKRPPLEAFWRHLVIEVHTIISSLLVIIIILSFDIAPFPYKHAQRRITFHCQRIDVDIHLVNWYNHLWTDVFSIVVWRLPHSQLPEYYLGADSIVLGHRH